MTIKDRGLIILFLLLLTSTAFADLAPPSGYTRVQTQLTLEAKDDLSEYRFFLISGDLSKEIKLAKNASVEVGSLGGGARYISGTILAVPKAAVPDDISTADGNSGKFADRLSALPGVIELITHSFVKTVDKSEAADVKGRTYAIVRTEGGKIAANEIERETSNEDRPGGAYSREIKSKGFWATVAGGSLATFALIFFGVYMVRRRRTVKVGQ